MGEKGNVVVLNHVLLHPNPNSPNLISMKRIARVNPFLKVRTVPCPTAPVNEVHYMIGNSRGDCWTVFKATQFPPPVGNYPPPTLDLALMATTNKPSRLQLGGELGWTSLAATNQGYPTGVDRTQNLLVCKMNTSTAEMWARRFTHGTHPCNLTGHEITMMYYYINI
jgi:hypothetical protein